MQRKSLEDNFSPEELIRVLEEEVQNVQRGGILDVVHYAHYYVEQKVDPQLYRGRWVSLTIGDKAVLEFKDDVRHEETQQAQAKGPLSIPFSEVLDTAFDEYQKALEDYWSKHSEEELRKSYEALQPRINTLLEEAKNKVKCHTEDNLVALFLDRVIRLFGHEIGFKISPVDEKSKKQRRTNKKRNTKLRPSTDDSGNSEKAFTWLKDENEIEKLFNALIADEAIDSDANFEDFKKIYSSASVAEPVKIKWNKRNPKNKDMSSTPSLIALHQCLRDKGKISEQPIDEKFVKRLLYYFADFRGNNIGSPKDKLRNYKKTKDTNKDWAESIVAKL